MYRSRLLFSFLFLAITCGICLSAAETVIPPPPAALLKMNTGGKDILRFKDFMLSKPGARWHILPKPKSGMEFVNCGAYGYYKLKLLKNSNYFADLSANGVPIKANRNYTLSALIYYDFPHPKSEIDLGIRMLNNKLRKCSSGNKLYMENNGITGKSGKWLRWEFTFTSYPADCKGYFNLITRFRNIPALENAPVFCIADLYLEEHPAVPLVPFGKGKGVSFKGGPGKLPMRVESVKNSGGIISVQTTGCGFNIDTQKNIIKTTQRVRRKRELADWKFSLPLAGLKVISSKPEECILANDNVTLGIQCDSLMMVTPHKKLGITVTSRFGGKWNRFFGGHLFATDEFGGIAVNPAIPLGSGRVARARVITPNLDFGDKYNDVNFISTARKGWQLAWTLEPGERLGISVFPPRVFDWKKSFEMNYTLLFPENGVKRLKKLGKIIQVGAIWETVYRGVWAGGGECSSPYSLLLDKEKVIAFRKAVEAEGIVPIIYMSPRFYRNDDMDDFIKQVKRLRDLLGIRGVYYDGNPNDWVKAYNVMRMTRDIFPDGVIILHTTGKYYNGGTPLSMPDISMPCVDTYADVTLRGESVPGSGADWPYIKYVTSQYNAASCVGIVKGDKWKGIDETSAFLISLKYNGRGRMASDPRGFMKVYCPILAKLKKLWEEKGGDPDFYEKYYLPECEKLINPHINKN